MARIRAIMHFPLRELWTRRELLGTSHELHRDGRLVRITFPRDRDDFELGVVRDDWTHPAIASSGVFGQDPIEKVLIVQVDVEAETDFAAADFGRDEHEKAAAANAATRFSDECLALAEQVLNDFLAWTRVRLEQRWLGLAGERAESFTERLLDLDAGTRVPFGVLRAEARARPEETALDRDKVRQILELVADGRKPGLPEELLADAEHFSWRADETDLRRAVVLAAIACEVKVKQTLQAKAPANAARLVELSLKGPRSGVSISAALLFDVLASVVTGRSLHVDDAPLFKRIEKLFSLRNEAAHRGGAPDRVAAIDGVRAARAAFAWLDGG